MTVAQQRSSNQKVCVVGLGYTGLPTAAILASRGYDVRGVEIREEAVKTINAGRAHIVEPDLDMLVQAAVSTGKLEAFAEPDQADIFILCVPTPARSDHSPDLQAVIAATHSICPWVREGNVVVLESTSPPGTTDRIAELVLGETGLPKGSVFFAHAPERVLPGKILREVIENARLIGGVDEASTEACAAFYRTFVTGDLHLTNARTAETVKLVENAFRDVNIAFANELSFITDRLGLDVWEVIALANRHPRVNILQPGPGVGGHCIAVDPWFLVASAPDETRLIQTARAVNDSKPAWIVDRVARRASRFKEPRIACLGLAYKPDVDDLRESPAVEVVRLLRDRNVGELLVVEPNLERHPEFDLVPVETALERADIVVVLVAHEPFKRLPPKLLEEKSIVDACGAWRRA